MDTDTAGYKQERFKEISDEMANMLARVGWKKDFIAKNVPMIPISGWIGDNLLKKSDNMPWWSGKEVVNIKDEKVMVETLLHALNDMASVPQRDDNKPMRLPISG